jgi:hypothetical protein
MLKIDIAAIQDAESRAIGATAVLSVLTRRETQPGHPHFAMPRFRSPQRIIEVSDIHAGRIWPKAEVEEAKARGLVEPERQHALEILRFGRIVRAGNPNARILIHCHGGVSRSPAAALLIMADEDGRGREAASVARLLEDHPHSCPNPALVAHGDALLERNGALSKALEAAMAVKRLQPTGLEQMFL